MKLTDYNYRLPHELIAQAPAVPRDSSRLFVYDTKTNEIAFDHFYNLDKYLPKNSFLVLNNTKVLPARVELKKSNGGKVIALLLVNELLDSQIVRALVDRKVNVGDKLFIPIKSGFIDSNHFFQVINQKEKIFYLRFNFGRDWLLKKIVKIGRTPVPLYLRKTPLRESELRRKYQTIFATLTPPRCEPTPSRCGIGSVAAPTASLHFTNRVFKRLEKKGIEKYFVTLHVGLGTFAPISEKNIQEKKLHEEFYQIDRNTWELIETNRNKGKKLVAVGTTVTRTLESLAKLKVPACRQAWQSAKFKIIKKTNLFIFPPYEFKMVDCLVTNFHLPNSSLMMLVEAFLQFKESKKHLVDLYQIAVKNNFRFYSFGDAMVIM